MDSLIASYASSDDEEETPQQQQQHNRLQFPPNSANDEPQRALVNKDYVPESNLRAHGKPFSLPKPKSNAPSSVSSHFASLPSPQSSLSESGSSLSSLPPPGSSNPSAWGTIRGGSITGFGAAHVGGLEGDEVDSSGQLSTGAKRTSGLLSSLPRPKSEAGGDGIVSLGSVERNGRRVVQFRRPTGTASTKKHEDDEEEEEEEERKKPREIPQSASVKSFLSSIPAPKNSSTFGVLSSLTSGHRLVVEEEKPRSTGLDASSKENEVAVDYSIVSDQSVIIHGSNAYSASCPSVNQNYVGYESYSGYENYAGHHGAADYGAYQGSWDYGATVGMASEAPVAVDSFIKASGKRGMGIVPTEIVEVKQDELIKDRPREDQVKLTGIAFGPAYQSNVCGYVVPLASSVVEPKCLSLHPYLGLSRFTLQPASSKLKPSKLHKRKHQIGSLFYDMKQKEMELAERRSRGFLTKAETQAKYGCLDFSGNMLHVSQHCQVLH
ncbi:hypothetical protein AKJ16_DCAP18580, partial [Drosera capensis]